MKLKTATAWAIVGYIVVFVINIYYFVFNQIAQSPDFDYETYERLKTFHECLSMINIIAMVLPVIFFIKLFNKQSKNEY